MNQNKYPSLAQIILVPSTVMLPTLIVQIRNDGLSIRLILTFAAILLASSALYTILYRLTFRRGQDIEERLMEQRLLDASNKRQQELKILALREEEKLSKPL